ncbi:transporter substrate-binding domain-containing protein, partial [Mesorhizobium sp. M0019]
MQTNSSRRQFVKSGLALTIALVTGLGTLAASTQAKAADNPYNLIDPTMISVGTMGDAKPYVFTDANGNFTGF